MTIHHVPKFMSCHKVIVVITNCTKPNLKKCFNYCLFQFLRANAISVSFFLFLSLSLSLSLSIYIYIYTYNIYIYNI